MLNISSVSLARRHSSEQLLIITANKDYITIERKYMFFDPPLFRNERRLTNKMVHHKLVIVLI